MDNNSIFEAGRRIGWIENFYKTVIEKSTRFLVRAEEKQFSSIEAVLLSYDYGNPEEFMCKAEAYKQELLDMYREYYSIKQEFPNLSYFNDDSNTFGLELKHQNAFFNINKATSVLNEYLEYLKKCSHQKHA